MPLFLHKLLPVFLLPIGLTLLLLLAGLMLRNRKILLSAFLLLYVSSLPVVGRNLLKLLEDTYPEISAEQSPAADAAVVLGGMLAEPHQDAEGIEWNQHVDRFEAGLRLVRAGKVRQLVLTGGRTPWQARQLTEGQLLRREALARGVPAEAIRVTPEVGNTAAEAAAVAAMAQAEEWGKIILITTGWHMPRAAALFREQGLNIVPFPVDFSASHGHRTTLLDFVPSADALKETEIALRECYGRLYYFIF